MIYSVGIPALLVLILIIWKRQQNQIEEGKFRYRIHKLRRKLHNLSQNGYADKNSCGYNYLESMLSIALEKSNCVTLFNLLWLEFRHRMISKDIDHYRKIYIQALKKIESDLYLYEINESRIRIFTDCIIGRNKITWILITNLFPLASTNYRVIKFIRNRVVCFGFLLSTL